MKELQQAIETFGRARGENVVKVDMFLNHRIDTGLLFKMGKAFADEFACERPTMILTVEASGIALATICAQKYGVPMIFAKKAKSDNIEGGLYQSEIFSYTYKKKVTLLVAQDWLKPEDKVLIIDDFMAKGYAVHGLIDIVEKAGAQLMGVGIAVEKGFQHGGDDLREKGYNIHSLAIIDKAEPGCIEFREDAE